MSSGAVSEDEYNFTKFYLGDTDPEQAAQEALDYVDGRCRENGLEPVQHASEAHFVCLTTQGNAPWLHFDSKGHFLPLSTHHYLPVVPDLSNWKDSVTIWVREPDSFTLRRYHNGTIQAQYANLNSGQRFESMYAAEEWAPVYEDWEDVLPEGTTAQDFYEALPPPTTLDTPTPIHDLPGAELRERMCKLFAWDERLFGLTVQRNKQLDTGFAYRDRAGDYADTDTGLVTYVRCYRHLEPGDMYARHW